MSQPDSQWLAAVDNVVEAALAHGGASAGGRRRSGMVLAGVASTLTCTPVLCAIARHFASASVSAVLQAQPSSAWRSALACHGLAPHHPLPANFIIAKLLNACYAVPREAVTAGTPAPGSLPNTELPFGFHADGQRTVAEQVDAAMGVGTATATAWTAATAAARAHATRVLLACVSASSVDADLASSAGEALVRGCVASDKVRSRCPRCWVWTVAGSDCSTARPVHVAGVVAAHGRCAGSFLPLHPVPGAVILLHGSTGTIASTGCGRDDGAGVCGGAAASCADAAAGTAGPCRV